MPTDPIDAARTTARSCRVHASLFFAVLALAAGPLHAQTTVTIYATTVDTNTVWMDESEAEHDPARVGTGPEDTAGNICSPCCCGCPNTRFAFNDTTNETILRASQFENYVKPNGHAITGVTIDAMCRYNDNTTGRVVMRLEVPDVYTSPDILSPSFTSSSSNCAYRMGAAADNFELPVQWTQALVNTARLTVRRENDYNTTRLNVKAFRIRITSDVDTDGDNIANSQDPDDDNDGVLDGSDPLPLNPDICGDSDGDGCDDCDVGTDNFGPLPDNLPNNDGTDTDGDGRCNSFDADDDNDGVPDFGSPFNDPQPLNPDICGDLDGDGCDDCSVGTDNFGPLSDRLPGNDGIDTDGDGLCNSGDTDDDNDGVPDIGSPFNDPQPLNPDICGDLDGDGCDDCSVGTDNFGPASDRLPNNDGPDTDGDGRCNSGDNCPTTPNTNQANCDNDGLGDACDPDDDNDNRSDALDSAPCNRIICADTDGDGCDDCNSGTFNPAADGTDTDADGLCNTSDTDDDNDGVADVLDLQPLNPDACGDSDGDGCDDCSVGTDNFGPASDRLPGNDGTDTDGDGQCNAGDTDDDNDGVTDVSDPAPLNPNQCGDSDGDGCDDCIVGTDDFGPQSDRLPSNDGTDTDGDGRCNSGDTDDDNDGVPDASDVAPLDPHRCADRDLSCDAVPRGDGCDDCDQGADGFGPQPDNRPEADGPDRDHDGFCDSGDNCPDDYNPCQEDTDGDGIGDRCEDDCDNNHIADEQEIQQNPSLDCNVNGRLDICEFLPTDRAWNGGASGVLTTPSLWCPIPSSVPGPADRAIFSRPGSYQARLISGTLFQNRRMVVNDGSPELLLGSGRTYAAQAPSGQPLQGATLIVAESPGSVASLALRSGTLRIGATGPTATPESARIGDRVESVGSLEVSGFNTLFTTNGELCVGCEGDGTLRITTSARAINAEAVVGEQSLSAGHVLVDGFNSRWTLGLDLTIRRGEVVLANGGTIEVIEPSGAVRIRQGGSLTGSGQVQGNLINFGTLRLDSAGGSTLFITGDFDQVSPIGVLGGQSGSMFVECEDDGAGGIMHGAAVVSGAASLGGGLFVQAVGPLTPAIGANPAHFIVSSSVQRAFDVAFLPGMPADRFMTVAYSNGVRGTGAAASLVVAPLAGVSGFEDPEGFAFVGVPSAAAAGDLDRDGDIDLAVTLLNAGDPEQGNGRLLILFNAGGAGDAWGGFPTSGAVQLNVGRKPSAVAIADLDNVNGNDLVVCNENSDNAIVFAQSQAQPGAFALINDITGISRPRAIAIADIDHAFLRGVGLTHDLAIAAAGSDTLQVILNNGLAAGTLSLSPLPPIEVPEEPIDVRPGDYDGDKDADFVVVSAATNAVAILRLSSQEPVTYDPPILVAVGAGPVQAVSARLNGDDLDDIAVVNRTDGSVSVIVNITDVQAPQPDLAFAAPVTTAVGPNARSIGAADLDNDGDTDLAVLTDTESGGSAVRVLRNDLNGGPQLVFSPAPDLDTGPGAVAVLTGSVSTSPGSEPEPIDLDQNGTIDVITINAGTGLRADDSGILVQRNTSCRCDWNQADGLDSQDYFDFLEGLFSANADFNGANGTDSQDYFDFLECFFDGCGQ